MKHRVFLVEDHPVMREGLRSLLARAEDLEVIGEAATGVDAFAALQETDADLVLVDLSIPQMSGLELVKQIRALDIETPVLVVSAHSESLYAERAVRAGAQGFVMKQEPPETMLTAIRSVLDGHIWLSPDLRERLLDTYLAGDAASTSGMADLSDRELEVMRHFGQGLSTAQVADAMMISPKTVETHRVHIKRKLGLDTTNEFVRAAAVWVESMKGGL